MITPLQTLKGFRDFLPQQKRARDHVQNTIVSVFERFGFEPIETPTLEYADLLLGKYGSEADKLVYTFSDLGGRQVGLRYDQTVPTARVLAQYQHLLPRHFRRYQIQNVFRADKPQQGRFREFTHCDIDIFGTTSPLADAEILACTYSAYQALNFPRINLSLNYRPFLIDNFRPFATDSVTVSSILQSLDKLDKQSVESIIEELERKGLPLDQARRIIDTINHQVPWPPQLDAIRHLAVKLGVPDSSLNFDPRLVRGLDYYTGIIFEVTLPGYQGGSVAGGGRYDHLIQDLGGPSIPAVGLAFGFDRTVSAAQALDLIPAQLTSPTVLVTVFNPSTLDHSLQAVTTLRQAGIRTILYPDADTDLPKQLKYAHKAGLPFTLILGPDETANNVVTLKDMSAGTQTTDTLANIIPRIK